MTNDMAKACKPKSDQLNADDLIGGDLTIKIRDAKVIDSEQQPVSIYFDGDNGKPYKPSKGMSRVMVRLWGADSKQYIGKSMTLHLDPSVTWGGVKVGGIRITHMSHIEKAKTFPVTASKTVRKEYTVEPLKVETTILGNEEKYNAGIITINACTTLDELKTAFTPFAKQNDLTDSEWKSIIKTKDLKKKELMQQEK